MARPRKGVLLAGGLGAAVLATSCFVCSSTGLLGGSRTPTAVSVNAGAGSVPTAEGRVAEPKAAAAATPTSPPAGKTRESPAPLGQAVVTGDGFEITVLEVQRGSAAAATLQSYNTFNCDPKAGMQCLLVNVSMKALGDASKTQRIATSYFRVTGAKGVIYDGSWDVMGKELASELYGGASTEGELSFEVAQDDEQLVLIYAGAGTEARYLALEE